VPIAAVRRRIGSPHHSLETILDDYKKDNKPEEAQELTAA
jgi:hypothetical protein